MSDTAEIVVVGAGPYGLSVGAHLRARGTDMRIFGQPMSNWERHMPAGMLLKSDGFASSLAAPGSALTLQAHCAHHGVPYHHTDLPVGLETFIGYGKRFQEAAVPDLDCRNVTSIEPRNDGFAVRLEDGDTVAARRVILAVGTSYFAHVPSGFGHLPVELASHSSAHHDLSGFKGRSVAVVGGGASAIDLAVLLHEAGARVSLVARRPSLSFNRPDTRPRWRRPPPRPALGGGWANVFYERAPQAFRQLPNSWRRYIVQTALGPSAGYPMMNRVAPVTCLLGHTVHAADAHGGGVHLKLVGPDGDLHDLNADHVIAATGFAVDVRRLTLLSRELRSQIRGPAFTPTLTANFETSFPGLYMVGLAAAPSFGPSMRFVAGAHYTARRLDRHLAKQAQRRERQRPAPQASNAAQPA